MATRGRPTNAERARRAAQAANQADSAAQQVVEDNMIEVETPPIPPQPEARREEPEEITSVPSRNEPRRKAMEEIEQRDRETKTGLGMEVGLTDEPKK